ncbi:DUF1254 domain-containing protein [Pseudomonas sp. H9]|uniref:DUF1254 domain-containing protein n=1 Tax=Pseudomonas sp. H9 TaxID=483968 RepID=UPI001057C872|nr:DUF1254 domain-containing protein [Pseudomonas sp. H9]TDF86259.1 DUF1254 domain-containing protein [Pseudomonas sp. H9]
MQTTRVLSVGLMLGLAMASIAPTQASEAPQVPQVAKATADWRENYAYTLGVQAYIFAFPWSYNAELRWLWVTQPVDPTYIPYAPQNQFWHARHLANAKYRNGGTPNNDTLYSIAWLDLKPEPMILSVPDAGDRYYVMEMASMDSDNFAYVGSRSTGPKAGNYLIAGPDWKGELPAGVKQLPASRSNVALIIGRTLVDGSADLPEVHKLQEQYRLTPLSRWGKPQITGAEQRDVWKPYDRKADPLNEWRTINRAMTENPPQARLEPLLRQFASIGVGPGQNVETLDDATRRGLARAAVDGRKLLQDAVVAGYSRTFINGWGIGPEHYGRLGLHDKWLGRAALQSLGGIIANEVEEASYISARFDAEGQPLDGGKNRYVVRFAPDALPDVKAFWSMSIYDATFNFAENPIDRYSIGDRTPGLVKDPDGGLTLYLQTDDPGVQKRSNWLPIPPQRFATTFRAYVPGEAIQQRRWAPPPVQALSLK